jgi:hypothetical protein
MGGWCESGSFCLAVAFSSAPARIRTPGAEGHRLRRLTHGDTRRDGDREAPIPDFPAPGRGLFSQFGVMGTMIREQLTIAVVAFAISFVAISEVLLSLM